MDFSFADVVNVSLELALITCRLLVCVGYVQRVSLQQRWPTFGQAWYLRQSYIIVMTETMYIYNEFIIFLRL